MISKTIQTALGIVTILPGVAVLLRLFPLPEQVSQLCTIICAPLSLVAVLFIIFISPTIADKSSKRIAIGATVSVVVGAILFVSYFFFVESRSVCASFETVAVSQNDSARPFKCKEILMLPMRPKERLEELAKGGAIVEQDWNEPQTYQEMINSSSKGEELIQEIKLQNNWTELIVVLLLIAAQLLFTVPTILIAAMIKSPKESPPETPVAAPAQGPAADPPLGPAPSP